MLIRASIIIDPPTRSLVYVSYYPVEANTFVSVLNSALIALGNQHYKVSMKN
jgi:hypothetical protein